MPSVTRKSGSGRTRRGEAEANVFAALERLLEHGGSYTEIGIQQIADEAGIGRSTFYVHFADKTDLLIRMTEAATEELFAAAGEWVVSEDTDVHALEHAMYEIVRLRREHAGALRAVGEVSAYDPQVARFWRGRVDAFAEALIARAEAEQERGLIRQGVDIRHTAGWAVWGVERYVEQKVNTTAGGEDDRRLAEAMARAVWQLFYTPEAAPDDPARAA